MDLANILIEEKNMAKGNSEKLASSETLYLHNCLIQMMKKSLLEAELSQLKHVLKIDDAEEQKKM